MHAHEWLRQTFDTAMRTTNPPYEELRTELLALSEAGALLKDDAARASAQLEEAERDRAMITRRRHERAVSLGGALGGDPDRLEGLLTPEHPLGEIEGITVVVMRVELWSQRLVVRLEALRTEITDALDMAFDTEWRAYESRWVQRRAAAEAEDLWPPEQPSVPRLSGLPLSVTDDLGTRYHATFRATGGSEHPWRSEWRLEPGVPRSAAVLRIGLEHGEDETERLELRPPWRS